MEWEAETSDADDHYFDFCYSIRMISVKDEEFENIGCVLATDTDYFDIFVNNFIQPIIEDECQHVELFKVDDVMKAVENDIPESETVPLWEEVSPWRPHWGQPPVGGSHCIYSRYQKSGVGENQPTNRRQSASMSLCVAKVKRGAHPWWDQSRE